MAPRLLHKQDEAPTLRRKWPYFLAFLLVSFVLYLLVSTLGINTAVESYLVSQAKAKAAESDNTVDDAKDEIELPNRPIRGEGNLSNYTFYKTPPFQGFDVNLDMNNTLEFLKNVPVVVDYWRPERIRPHHAKPRKDGSEPVRIACLYAGFVRDFEKMWMTCGDMKRTHPKFCNHPKRRKFFGQQRANIVDATECDIFLSTWDIRGAGRFNTVVYDYNKTVTAWEIRKLYGARLARLHMQNYTAYQPLWYWMYGFKRDFPQTHPTVAHVDSERRVSWEGVPESNPFVRINDYSQSYKQWCVLQLVNRFSNHYDLYFRLRTDLRSTHMLENFRFADNMSYPLPAYETAVPGSNVTAAPPAIPFKTVNRTILFDLRKMEDKEKKYKHGAKYKRPTIPPKDANGKPILATKAPPGSLNETDSDVAADDAEEDPLASRRDITAHSIHASRLHVNNFDIGDFGFMGPPAMVTELAKLWDYCIAPSELRSLTIDHDDISEYNLMLWRIVFDNKWQVDSGGRYLWVSRRGAMEAKKLSGGTTILRVVRGPSTSVKQGAGVKVVVRHVKKKV
jgi:hypothetical protein